MPLTKKLKILGLIFFIGGFLLTYCNWWINDYMPTLFFVILGLLLWIYGVNFFFKYDNNRLKKSLYSFAISLSFFIILTSATEWVLLSVNYS